MKSLIPAATILLSSLHAQTLELPNSVEPSIPDSWKEKAAEFQVDLGDLKIGPIGYRIESSDFEGDPLAGEGDPFALSGEERMPSEADARVVTKQGSRTLEVLRSEKIESVRIREFEEGYEIVRDRLAKYGIEVRLKRLAPGKIDSDALLSAESHESGGAADEEPFFKLEGVSLEKFMKVLDQWALAGWILYPDGSITYFEDQCCGSWPKDGIYCHDSQYEAGKPEVMKALDRGSKKTKQAEQAAAGDPVKHPNLK